MQIILLVRTVELSENLSNNIKKMIEFNIKNQKEFDRVVNLHKNAENSM